jgi:predicted Mrr-cat superfamily restriction endonuclease
VSEVAPNYWLVRTGPGSAVVDDFAGLGIVAVSWAGVTGLGDLREYDSEKLREVLATVLRLPAADARELEDFRDGMSVGDIVVSPNPKSRELLFGEVAGDYEWRNPEPIPGYRHVRTTNWLGRWDRESAPPSLQLDTKNRRIVNRLADTAGLDDVVTAMKAGEGRPAVPQMRPRPRIGTHRPTAKRPAAKAVASPDRVCSGCGYKWPAANFGPDSEFCRDCA